MRVTQKTLFLAISLYTLAGGCAKSPSSQVTGQNRVSDTTSSVSPMIAMTDSVLVKTDPALNARISDSSKANTAIELAKGLKIDLWASDSLAPDPVAIDIDSWGGVFINRTNRQKHSEFDIRQHVNWMTPSISFHSVEDRRKFLRKTFAPEKSKENEWLEDLNKDGSHDWKDLTVEKDEVWKLEDTNNDGFADKSTRVVNDFHEEVTDVAGGFLARDKDAFLTIAPDVWRLFDTNADGVYDKKTSISHGYDVHIGFGGHGMSNPIEGPDGKIYWNIGDIGANITSPDGVKHDRANEGMIGRANPDGSDFEIFAGGLRNTHEFVFDAYGNIISADNDGDHAGESERLVHIVEGSDAGWRSNWQYGKYTDPKNNDYKVWMDEMLYVPRWDGQAAYIIPPIQNFHNGPTGMQFNPGTALGESWKNKFFLVEFVGTPTNSPVWSFGLKPKGASFELDGEQKIISGILPTGIRFGPDGALYVADWINGWGTKNYGRIWKLDVAEDKNDLKAVREETKKLIQLDYTKQAVDELYKLLANDDMRIRLKAQFELVVRGDAGNAQFRKAIEQRENQLARIHGIWGLGQLTRKNAAYGKPLEALLSDKDPEIVAQAAKVIGDLRLETAGNTLVSLLENEAPRVKFFAAQALGRIKQKNAMPALLKMIEVNKDEDVYLRHSASLALARIGDEDALAGLVKSPVKSLRIAAVLALRRMKSEKVALFLQDEDEYIATEAARAINDDLSIPGALPALANVLSETRYKGEPLLRRGVNAALRVGDEDQMRKVVAFANRSDISAPLRAEALVSLGTWPNPSVLDRVDGRFRGEVKRDSAAVKKEVEPMIAQLLKSNEPEILIAAAQMLRDLNIKDHNEALAQMLNNTSEANVKVAVLDALSQLKYENMDTVMQKGMADENEEVRAAALGMIRELNLSKGALNAIAQSVLAKGTVPEQQRLLRVLGALPADQTIEIFSGLVKDLADKKLPESISLDLAEAIDSTKSQTLIDQMAPLRKTGTTIEAYQDALYGGNARDGARFIFDNSTAECVRCHAIRGQGGVVGPDLSAIGDKLSREQLLEALITPSSRLAPGYGMAVLSLKDGTTASGIVVEENDKVITLKTAEAEPLKIDAARVARRDNVPSSMPEMASIMTKRQVRDVIEFLSMMKKEQ